MGIELFRKLLSCYFIFTLVSCTEDEYSKTATVKLGSPSATYSEEVANSVKVYYKLDRARNVDTPLSVSWNSTDSTVFLGGDFGFSRNFKIKAFNTDGFFEVNIENDTQIDNDDNIVLKLIQPTDSKLRISDKIEESQFLITITNDDLVNPDQLQADLTWRRSIGQENINEVNFDLYLQSGVVFDNGVITKIGTTYKSSEYPGGFETIKLSKADKDQKYFLVVYFQKSRIDEKALYSLTLNGMGFTKKTFRRTFDFTEVGAAIFYGPFTKSGSTITSGRIENKDINAYQVPSYLLKELGEK
jgi:hypothetical protein